MEFRVLGPLEVVGADGVVAIPAGKQRAVLAVLVLHANEVVATDRLLEDVWGEHQPASGVKSLRYHVSKLRDVLERHGAPRSVIETRVPGYLLRLAGDELDALLFEDLLRRARVGSAENPAQAVNLLDEALGLWRGSPLADFTYRSFAQKEIRRLEELRLGAIEDRLGALVALGRHDDAVRELQVHCEEHPLRERSWGLLMLGLYRVGRQAEGLEAFQRLRTILGDELGIEPSPELKRLEEQILLQDPELDLAVAEPSERPATNLPVRLSSFVGREVELGEVGQLLADARLLTLVGPGGSGKTRVGLELAQRVLDDYSDGVWLVDLASLNDPGLVAATVAAVLGVKDVPGRSLAAGLGVFLASRRVLLVLDNCEHLIEAVARLSRELLEGTDGLRVLATSRELLGVPGEFGYEVGALSLPTEADDCSAVRAGSFDAVRLFVERGETARPGFRLTNGNAPKVGQICRRLDGMPLALELAAACLRVLPPEQIARRLDDRFRLLTGGARTAVPRQQTLRAAIDWSYDLLSEHEQQVFNRLSVFAGAFTLEAAERVCAGGAIEDRHVVVLLSRLVDKSLLATVHDQSGEVRFRMLETIGYYARERLAETGDADVTRRRHAEFHRDLAVGGAAQIRDGHRSWMVRLEVEHDDLRGALDWSLEQGEVELGLDLGGALFGFWNFHRREAKGWYSKLQAVAWGGVSLGRARVLEGFAAFAAEGNQSVAAFEEAVSIYRQLAEHKSLWRALQNLGSHLVELGERARAKAAFEEAVAIQQQAGDAHGCTLQFLGHLVYEEGDHRRARELFEEGVKVGRSSSAPCQSTNLQWMAALERREGNRARARTLLDQALESFRRMAARAEECEVITELAMVTRDEGDLSSAQALLQQSLETARQAGDLLDEARFVVWWVRRLASLETLAGHNQRAVRLYGAVDAHSRADFETWYDFERYDQEEYLDLIRAALDQNTFTQAWNEGKAMAVGELLEYAVEQPATGSVLPGSGTEPSQVTA